jgi:hypothetical protein
VLSELAGMGFPSLSNSLRAFAGRRRIHRADRMWNDLTVSDEIVLDGGGTTKVARVGNVVYRSPKPQSKTVLDLLKFLDSVGFSGSPRPIGDGFAPDGREMLEYIEGQSPQPFAWSNDATYEIGELLKQLHSVTSEWTPPVDAYWRPWFMREMIGERSVIGHGDLAPWNILAKDGRPVAFIDWDNAGPLDPVWELASVAWQNAQLYDDDVAEMNNLPDAAQRALQAKLILDGYGLAHSERTGFVDRMTQLAVWSAREEAIEFNVVPDTVSPSPSGFPILWAVTWRTRSAAWMLDRRSMLREIIEGI